MSLLSAAGIFFTLAATFQPFYNAAGAYSETGLDNATGSLTPGFNSSFGKDHPRRRYRSEAEPRQGSSSLHAHA
jgi:hypothetical protein